MTSTRVIILYPSTHPHPPTDLVLVEGVTMAEVPNKSDEMGLEADGRGGRVTSSRGREVLGGAEDVLTGLTQSMNLL